MRLCVGSLLAAHERHGQDGDPADTTTSWCHCPPSTFLPHHITTPLPSPLACPPPQLFCRSLATASCVCPTPGCAAACWGSPAAWTCWQQPAGRCTGRRRRRGGGRTRRAAVGQQQQQQQQWHCRQTGESCGVRCWGSTSGCHRGVTSWLRNHIIPATSPAHAHGCVPSCRCTHTPP